MTMSKNAAKAAGNSGQVRRRATVSRLRVQHCDSLIIETVIAFNTLMAILIDPKVATSKRMAAKQKLVASIPKEKSRIKLAFSDWTGLLSFESAVDSAQIDQPLLDAEAISFAEDFYQRWHSNFDDFVVLSEEIVGMNAADRKAIFTLIQKYDTFVMVVSALRDILKLSEVSSAGESDGTG